MHDDLIAKLEEALIDLDSRGLAMPAIHVAMALDSLKANVACQGNADNLSSAGEQMFFTNSSCHDPFVSPHS